MSSPENSPPPVSPGEILREEFMIPLNITVQKLAKDLQVSEKTLLQVLAGRRRVSRAMAHKLHMRLKTSTEFWLNSQIRYDRQKLAWW